MTNQGQTHEGGLLKAPAGGGSHYKNFRALQVHITQQVSLVEVMGDVVVANPGVEVTLRYRVPQGTNPSALMLDIEFYQRPGVWPQVETTRHVSFGRTMFGGPRYSEAEIVSGEVMMVRVPVEQL